MSNRGAEFKSPLALALHACLDLLRRDHLVGCKWILLVVDFLAVHILADIDPSVDRSDRATGS